MVWKMEWKFWYGIWKTPEWNGIFQEWNGRQSSILPYQFHTRFCALYLQKNTYWYWVVIDKYCHRSIQLQYLQVIFVDKSRYFGCLCCANIVCTVLYHCKYTLTTWTGLTCFFEIDNLPSPKFCFLTSSRKLVFVILFPFQLNFISIFSLAAYNNSFWC